MCRRQSKQAGNAFFVDADSHPQTIAVLRTRAEPLGIELVVGDPARPTSTATRCSASLVQYPGSSGALRDHAAAVRGAVHAAGASWRSPPTSSRSSCSTPPGEWGADIVVGSAQRFGVPDGLRRPPRRASSPPATCTPAPCPAASSACRTDTAGRPALRLALQTREQHIRREKATSQHLHGAGAARHHRRPVRGVARARRPAPRSPSGCTA